MRRKRIDTAIWPFSNAPERTCVSGLYQIVPTSDWNNYIGYTPGKPQAFSRGRHLLIFDNLKLATTETGVMLSGPTASSQCTRHSNCRLYTDDITELNREEVINSSEWFARVNIAINRVKNSNMAMTRNLIARHKLLRRAQSPETKQNRRNLHTQKCKKIQVTIRSPH